MNDYIQCGKLSIQTDIFNFINEDLLKPLTFDADKFWQGFESLIIELTPKNNELLDQRDELQSKIDQWHKNTGKDSFDIKHYKQFLVDIGYLVDQGDDFTISPQNVDSEITTQAGAQLVVPVMNARFALNACNARWGSLYDALYGTDVIANSNELAKTSDYNPIRGQAVIDYGRKFLDETFPLEIGSFSDIKRLHIDQEELLITLSDNRVTHLKNPEKFIGFRGKTDKPDSILFINHELHVEICIDQSHPIGSIDNANISDIILESATTVIMDCEDSVAAVDPADKLAVYKNWLGLMQSNLEESVTKQGKTFTRRMNPDKVFFNPQGITFTLPGRSLMFVRNVGHLMTSRSILLNDQQEIPEGILDAVITSLAGIFDLRKSQLSENNLQNSRKGSIYIVKPKMHGPEEVAFTNELFHSVESLLHLEANTLKIGIMDEERRTSVNLKACIRAAKERVVFINTGFLDRTGDEIHTSMEAGAFPTKDMVKEQDWITAYEKNNVSVGLQCGLQGKAQIGKGMWAMPDNMSEMLEMKIGQLKAGANTAWVPSPTAATIHALHYHQVDVFKVQESILSDQKTHSMDYIDTILKIPLLTHELTKQEITKEIKNNAQSILGYVVRWIDQGIGCSKVPNIDNVALMEDRATLRISSQLLSNWLHHGICTEAEVLEQLKVMATVVDQQNKDESHYQPMSSNLSQNIAFKSACELIFKGTEQPNGYTEPLLHRFRHLAKSSL